MIHPGDIMAQKDANLIDESQVKKASQAQFNRFYGEDHELNIPADDADLQNLPESPNGIYLFGISRDHPLDGKFSLPKAVVTGKIGTLNRVDLHAQPGEYLVFQIVIWSREKQLCIKNISCKTIEKLTCFNLDGVSFKGENFHKGISVSPRKTAVLWCGLSIEKNQSGTLSGMIQLDFDSGIMGLPLNVHVSGDTLKNGGEDDDFRMARLKWLNSKIGMEDEVPAPYHPLRREGKTIFLKGHSITLGNNGLPEEICSGYTNLNRDIAVPEKKLFSKAPQIKFGNVPFSGGELEFYEESNCVIKWKSGKLFGEINLNGTLRFRVSSENMQGICLDYTLSDVPYMLGLGVKRPCIPPDSLEWHWNPERWEDSFWAGNIDSGCIIRLTSGKDEEVPLLNCYYNWSPLIPPECWDNHGKGGISLRKEGKELNISCYSGEWTEKEDREYYFEFRLTPFHEIDYEKHYATRFFHPHMHTIELGEKDCFTDMDFTALREKGVNCINIHHAVSLNPIINYPFSGKSLAMLQKFVKQAHNEGFKVLIYYTVRELSVHCPEFKALYALNGEIFFPWQDNGKWPVTTPAEGPDPWFKEHLDYGFIPAWTEVIKSGPYYGIPDRSLITVPRSRMENFYLEGLRFLLERCPIDGLYLDDCDLSETGMTRLKRIFRKYRGGDPILDFHAWESFNSAYCVPLRDMERFPFLSRLWLGEGVKYDLESYENWLIRISGLPFGLTSEMLGKGNPYLGLLFGMTNRYGWCGEPCELWKIFDGFGIENSEMLLDIFPENGIGTDVADVHVTLWKKADGTAILAVGSWSDKPETVHLILPEPFSGRDLNQPEIPGFQTAGSYPAETAFEISPKQGMLFIIK